MHQFPFEKLQVWQKSRILVAEIYQITKSFPKEETYGLTNQVRRAIVSVPSNLAEGCTRKTKNERARFTTIAYSSLMETINQMILAKDLSYINENQYQAFREKAEEISRMLNALREAQMR